MCSSRKIHTAPTEGIEISWEVGGSVRPKRLKKCMKLNWNFQKSGESWKKNPSIVCVGRGGGYMCMAIFWNDTISETANLTYNN